MKTRNFEASSPQPLPTQARAGSVVIDMPRPGGRGKATARTPPPGLPADVAIGDWDGLFGAALARLKQIAACIPRDGDDVRSVRSNVLECTGALDQLRATLTHELTRHTQLELELSRAQTALACAGSQLAGSRNGELHAHHLARHDSLTSLPNRRFLHERLDRELADAAPRNAAFALLYLDLDGLKPINDAHGHDAGDELLRIVAVRLIRAVRSDDMVSRLGGDEFACLLNGLHDREQLSRLASKLFDAVSAPLTIGRLKITVSPSIGIAVCPADGATVEALLKSADAAMYQAKRHRTGYAFFDACGCDSDFHRL